MFDRKRFFDFFARAALSFAFLGMAHSAHAQRDDQRLLEGWLAKMGKLFEQARAGQDSRGGLEKARALRAEMFREIAGGPLACEFFARVLLLEAIFEFQVGDTRAAGWHYQEALSLLPNIGDRVLVDSPSLVAFFKERKREWEDRAKGLDFDAPCPQHYQSEGNGVIQVICTNECGEVVVLDLKEVAKPKPEYPPASLAWRKEAVIKIKVVIDTEGKPISIFFPTECELASFYVASADALYGWRFEPVVLDGKPIKIVGNVSFTFKMAGSKSQFSRGKGDRQE